MMGGYGLWGVSTPDLQAKDNVAVESKATSISVQIGCLQVGWSARCEWNQLGRCSMDFLATCLYGTFSTLLQLPGSCHFAIQGLDIAGSDNERLFRDTYQVGDSLGTAAEVGDSLVGLGLGLGIFGISMTTSTFSNPSSYTNHTHVNNALPFNLAYLS